METRSVGKQLLKLLIVGGVVLLALVSSGLLQAQTLAMTVVVDGTEHSNIAVETSDNGVAIAAEDLRKLGFTVESSSSMVPLSELSDVSYAVDPEANRIELNRSQPISPEELTSAPQPETPFAEEIQTADNPSTPLEDHQLRVVLDNQPFGIILGAIAGDEIVIPAREFARLNTGISPPSDPVLLSKVQGLQYGFDVGSRTVSIYITGASDNSGVAGEATDPNNNPNAENLYNVIVDGVDQGPYTIRFEDDDGVKRALIATLDYQQLGLSTNTKIGNATPINGDTNDQFIDLLSVKQLSVSRNGSQVTVDKLGRDISLGEQASSLPESTRPANQATSFIANYSLQYSRDFAGEFSQLNVPVNVAARHQGFLFENGLEYNHSDQASGTRRTHTRLTYDDIDTRRRVILGDTSLQTNNLGATGEFAGITLQTHDDLKVGQRGVNTQAITGTLKTRSVVELYIHNQLILRRNLPPGPFRVANFPLNFAGSTATVVVRGSDGEQQRYELQIFGDGQVLAENEHEFTYHLGFARRLQDGYAPRPTAIAHHRIGATSQLTVGGRIELDNELMNIGAEASYQATPKTFIRTEVAASRDFRDGQTGFATILGVDHFDTQFSANAEYRYFSEDYANLNHLEFGNDLMSSLSASASVRLQDNLELTIGARQDRFHSNFAQKNFNASLNYNLSHSTTLRLFGNYNLTSGFADTEDYSIGIDVSHSFAGGQQVTGGTTIDSAGTLQTAAGASGLSVTGLAGEESPWSINATRVSTEENEFSAAEERYDLAGSVSKITPWGHASVGTNIDNQGNGAVNLSYAGGLSVTRAGTTIGEPVTGGFAVVHLTALPPGVAKVEIRRSGALVGTLDSPGKMSLPNLIAYTDEAVNITYLNAEGITIEQRDLTIAVAPNGAAFIDADLPQPAPALPTVNVGNKGSEPSPPPSNNNHDFSDTTATLTTTGTIPTTATGHPQATTRGQIDESPSKTVNAVAIDDPQHESENDASAAIDLHPRRHSLRVTSLR